MRRARSQKPGPRGPGTVTALVAKRGSSERLVVHLDGAAAFDVATIVADEAGLRQGVYLDEPAQDSLLQRDTPYRARAKALAALAVRDRCRTEIVQRLRMAGFEEDVIAGATGWLEELGYLDDRRFSTAYAAERTRSGWGVRRIRAELLRKGVSRAVVEEVVSAQVGGPEPEPDSAATALARRRFGRQFATDPEGARRRVSAFLARRGHDWDEIERIVAVLTNETESGEEGRASAE